MAAPERFGSDVLQYFSSCLKVRKDESKGEATKRGLRGSCARIVSFRDESLSKMEAADIFICFSFIQLTWHGGNISRIHAVESFIKQTTTKSGLTGSGVFPSAMLTRQNPGWQRRPALV